jgi:hypothetical protein
MLQKLVCRCSVHMLPWWSQRTQMQMIAAMLCLQGCSPKGPLTGGGCIKIDLDDGELDI